MHMESTHKTSSKVLAALSYVGVLSLIPLLFGRGNEFVRHHARQGFLLFIVEVAVSFIAWIPLVGWALGIATIVLSAYGVFQALSGTMWELPWLGAYAKKLNF